VIVSEAVISHTFSGPLSAIGDSIRNMRDRYAGQPLVDCALAPHAIYTCDRDMLAEMAAIAAADNLMIHMHLSETESEVENCLKEHKMLPVEYLKDLGYLEQRCIFAHGVWLSEKELDLMQGTNCGIAVCTDSNLKLSSGFLPLKAIRERVSRRLWQAMGGQQQQSGHPGRTEHHRQTA
jgi:5-methylthioadenosine/S-adenosylhomocysteine deaminase